MRLFPIALLLPEPRGDQPTTLCMTHRGELGSIRLDPVAMSFPP